MATRRLACKAPGCLRRGVRKGYCDKHSQQIRHHGHITQPKDPRKEFWARVQVGTEWECWPWTKAVNGDGYGTLRTQTGQVATAHRTAYEYAVGPVPPGLLLDHLCHTPRCDRGVDCLHRRCCNPAHLKPVTPEGNSAPDRAVRARGSRVTACPQGHPYTVANTRTDKRGSRHCRECERARRK